MGQHFSTEPVVDKETERDQDDTFTVAVSSCQGWRIAQEDNHSLILNLPGEKKSSFFAVYDGHGGAQISKRASEVLWRILAEDELYLKGQYEESLENVFLTFDRDVYGDGLTSGTTAVCLLVVDKIVYCANIGDSRGVACIDRGCIPLSFDHKPENPQELKRIMAAGGYVLNNRVNGSLALSRAFGDFNYKCNKQLPADQQIVSPCPEIRSIQLDDSVDFLVLACDGIWDVLTSEEVVEFVLARLEDQMELGLICEQLTTKCMATDYELLIGCDNMTVLIACHTRGRSWEEYCSDVAKKGEAKIGTRNSNYWSETDYSSDQAIRFSKINESPTTPAETDADSTATASSNKEDVKDEEREETTNQSPSNAAATDETPTPAVETQEQSSGASSTDLKTAKVCPASPDHEAEGQEEANTESEPQETSCKLGRKVESDQVEVVDTTPSSGDADAAAECTSSKESREKGEDEEVCESKARTSETDGGGERQGEDKNTADSTDATETPTEQEKNDDTTTDDAPSVELDE